MMRPRHPQFGVTLIELVVALVVIAIATAALTLLVSNATRHSADPMVQEQASAIAQAYLEEVMLKPFCDPKYDPDGNPATPTDCRTQCVAAACSTGACGGVGALKESSRALYDDVCDYNGLTDSGAKDQNGNPIPGLGGYTVAVSVDDHATLNGLNGAAGQVVRVDVRVSHSGMDDVILSAFKANY